MHHNQLSKKPQTSISSHIFTALQVILIGLGSFALLSGCQATKGALSNFEDGSLAYQEAEMLDPIELPADQETAPFVPLYPTPTIGNNTIDVENESGKRFELPAPKRQVNLNN